MPGFFNFLVYVRPRIVQYQHRHPEKSLWSAISRAIQRTLTVFYISESRTFHDTELQDIEVLDPCYALQNEQEQEKLEEKERKTRKSSQDKNVIVGEQGNQHDDPFHYDDDDGTDITNIVKTPIILNESASRLEKRRLDELKLLEEDDPSFYEGNGSRRYDLSEDLSEEEKCDMSDHSEGDVYLEDGPQIEHKDTDKNLYQMISPGIATKDESEHTEERRQKDTKKYSALENYFYPEFSSDPDFYFMWCLDDSEIILVKLLSDGFLGVSAREFSDSDRGNTTINSGPLFCTDCGERRFAPPLPRLHPWSAGVGDYSCLIPEHKRA